MGRVLSIGVHQVKVKPRPLVGTKTYIRETQRRFRDIEWQSSGDAQVLRSLLEIERSRIRG